jgi:RecA-family ATPase
MRVIRPGEPTSFDRLASALEARHLGLVHDLDSVEHLEPAPQERRSRFFPASDLEGRPIPPREWLVPDLIPHRTVTLFSGDGGTGKSLLALQLAVAAATDGRWIGRDAAGGSVLYLSAEDDTDELHRRLADILAASSRTFRDLQHLTLRSLAGEDALLAVETAVNLATTALFAELEAASAQRDIRLIVLDTLADLYPANENDRAKVRQFVGILRGLALRRHCAVVLLAHPSLSGLTSGSGTSGSTAWNNSVRSRLYLERVTDNGHEPDPDKRRLRTMKANYGQIGGEISLTWRKGVFVPEDTQASGLDRMAATAKAERVFLKLLQEFTAQGRPVNPAAGPNYAPKLFAAHPKAEGVTRRGLQAAMEALLSNGTLTVESEGPPSRRVTRLARGAA